jgi:hypothetical protein
VSRELHIPFYLSLGEVLKTLRSKIDASVIASSTASHHENVRIDAEQVLIFSSRSPFQ